MKINLFLLAMMAFLAGLNELVLAGILPFVMDYFNINTQEAGYLVTVFALIFGLAGPVLMSITMNINRKTLLLVFLSIFIVGNLMSVLAQFYWMMMLSRIVLAASVSMLIGLALSLSVKVVPEYMQARAIGVIMMSISGSLVLGTPIGIYIAELTGWKMIFVLISVLSVILMLLLVKYFPKNIQVEHVSMARDWKFILKKEILSVHLFSFLFFVGQGMFFVYLTPYLMDRGHTIAVVGLIYLVFGLAGIIGSGIGGYMTDKFGSTNLLVVQSFLYVFLMLMVNFTASSAVLVCINIAIWAMTGWMVNAPTQTYLIQAAPKFSSINQTVSTSSTQFGISLGALLGGICITQTNSYPALIYYGCIVLAIAFLVTLYIRRLNTK